MTTKPDYHNHEEFRNRSTKRKELLEMGIEPYPHQYHPTHSAELLHSQFDGKKLGAFAEAAEGKTEAAGIAGRLILFRAMGKNAFAHIQDHTGKIQVMFNRELSQVAGYGGEGHLKVIEKLFDLGDLLGVEGHLFHTQKGELTLFVKRVTLLCKTLLPLAEKHAGLQDKEICYRKRWLDLISNPAVGVRFRQRSEILRAIRHFFEERGFIEVETPVLQSIYGGAEARPFTTELHALHQEMFLRISLEIPLKKLLVGGMDRVFEMGRVFRNEGIDRSHNPEFTLLEAYAAYWDYKEMMAVMEQLVESLAIRLFGVPEIAATHPQTGEPVCLHVKSPWPRLTMKESIERFAGSNVDQLSDDELRNRLKESGHIDLNKLKALSRGLMIAALFEIEVEPHLIQPHHIIDHPVETTPLCKRHRDKSQEDMIERFESFILGGEICNAYTELNDPVEQRMHLEEQALRRERGDEEASPLDEEFLEAICQGMPPTGGLGIGIDRLVMLLTNSHSIRDVLFFPWMRPE